MVISEKSFKGVDRWQTYGQWPQELIWAWRDYRQMASDHKNINLRLWLWGTKNIGQQIFHVQTVWHFKTIQIFMVL